MAVRKAATLKKPTGDLKGELVPQLCVGHKRATPTSRRESTAVRQQPTSTGARGPNPAFTANSQADNSGSIPVTRSLVTRFRHPL
jgi:hypothetical protein